MTRSQRRFVLVTRRFWPLVGGAETQMAALANELKKHGADVTILTAHWDHRWPQEIVHRGVRIVRLPNPAIRGWGTWKYMTSLEQWLKDHAAGHDLVYVSMLKHDAYSALSVRDAGGAPVVLRAEGAGESGDIAWERNANFGRRIGRRCRTADAVIAPSPDVKTELLEAGYSAERVHNMNNGIEVPEIQRTEISRRRARADLAHSVDALALPDRAPLAVFTGRFHKVKGLDTLLAAWPLMLEAMPEARLWLVGEGPEEPAILEQIERLKLSQRVTLAGTFDSVEQHLAAADCFVLPSLEEGMSLALLEAMAAGVPVVATDIPGNRNVVEADSEGILVPTLDADELAAGILRIFSDAALADRLGGAARGRVEREFSLVKMAREYLELFDRIIVNANR